MTLVSECDECDNPDDEIPDNQEDDRKKIRLFVQYRGKYTEEYAQALRRIKSHYRVIMTMRKLKTDLPSLRPPVEKMVRSNVMYKLTCPRCESCYVGQTRRQLQRRFSDHVSNIEGPMKTQLQSCDTII